MAEVGEIRLESFRYTLCDVPIDTLSLADAVQTGLKSICSGQRRSTVYVFVNPHSLVMAKSKPDVLRAFVNSDYVLADGAGVLLAGKIHGFGFPERVSGPDFFLTMLEKLRDCPSQRVFLFGSTESVLDKLRTEINRRYPYVNVVGTLSPPFREFTAQEEIQQCEQINAAMPDVLWVGMTAPKQESWVSRNRHRLEVPVIGCIGAAFDFVAGSKKRSPQWFRDRGLEWLPRLVMEPTRLWRRTFVSAPIFLFYVFQEKLRRSSGSGSEPRNPGA